MLFRTIINIAQGDPIDHSDKIMLLGSCFTDEIGEQLNRRYFKTCINPFGALYNPGSIANAIHQLGNKPEFHENELINHNGQWHSFSHHSRYSSADRDEALNKINSSFISAKKFFSETKIFIITFGTAYIYELAKTGETVANCHKLHPSTFTRRLMSVDEIVEKWQNALEIINTHNPSAKIIFTVSPIRHLADGAHGNQISKATLLLAINKLTAANECCSYFPSYEIVLDELRDYRFYANDMTHPSKVAVDYIYERFSETYFTKATLRQLKDYERLWSLKNHTPMSDNADNIKALKAKIAAMEASLGLTNID